MRKKCKMLMSWLLAVILIVTSMGMPVHAEETESSAEIAYPDSEAGDYAEEMDPYATFLLAEPVEEIMDDHVDALREDGADPSATDSDTPLETVFLSESGVKSIHKPTMKELAAAYENIGTIPQLYETEPSLSTPGYHIGTLTDDAAEYVKKYINYYRLMAGVQPISLDSSLNESAAWGALTLAIGNQFSHTPSQPSGMSDEDYQKGYYATSHSNLSRSGGYDAQGAMKVAVTGQMEDKDSSNIDRVGHRRWLLDPFTQTMGAGTANRAFSYYTAIRVMGEGVRSSDITDLDYVAWPASGNNLSDSFPVNTPWSISLNAGGWTSTTFKTPDRSKLRITLKDLQTGRTWDFDNDTGTEYSVTSNYYTLDDGGYGGLYYCLIFRPAYQGISKFDGDYEVRVEGLETVEGNPAVIDYVVTFADVEMARTMADVTHRVSSASEVRSDHPYANGSDVAWIYRMEDAESLDVKFNAETKLASGDYLYVYDAESKEVGKYSGDELAGRTVNVPGSVVRIRLVAEGSGGAYGFGVDDIARHVPMTGINLDKETVELLQDDEALLQVSYEPENTTDDRAVTWSSNNMSVVTVENGLVKAVGKGNAVITATVGKFTRKCTVKVLPSVQGLTLEQNSARLYVGQIMDLIFTYDPEDALAHEASAVSTASSVASVQLDEGKRAVTVTAAAAGETTVMLKADKYVANCAITVKDSLTLNYEDEAGTTREIKVRYGVPLSALSGIEPEWEGHVFAGWYTARKGRGEKVTADTVLGSQQELYAYWKKGATAEPLTAELVEQPCFTGTKLTPILNVYSGSTLLRRGTDYSLSYKNNVNAYIFAEGQEGFDSTVAPTVTVKGKGTYAGKVQLYFTILPRPLTDGGISVDDQWIAYTGNELKVSPVVTYCKQKLVEGRDYELAYPDVTTMPDSYRQAGAHQVTLRGCGNYSDGRSIVLHVYDAGEKGLINLGAAKIKVPKSKDYTGTNITLSPDELTVTAKVNGKQVVLTDEQYVVSYVNNQDAGTATVVISGVDKISYGSKKAFYKINGTDIRKATVDDIGDVMYDGTPKTPEPVITINGNRLNSGSDYAVSYDRNTFAGKATMVIQGRGRYVGVIKRTFKIISVNFEMSLDLDYEIDGMTVGTKEKMDETIIETPYEKGGTKPSVGIKYGNQTLREGVDYVVRYANNSAVSAVGGANGSKAPLITILGKGSFSGKVTKNFVILPKSLDEVTAYVPDKTPGTRAGAWLSKPLIFDSNGVMLKEGTDYVVGDYKLMRTESAPEILTQKSVISEPGTIMVDITGKGAYSATGANGTNKITVSYTVGGVNFTGLKVDSIAKDYQGSPVTLEQEDFLNDDGSSKVNVRVGKVYKPLNYGKDFEIVEGTYTSNYKAGTATVRLRGLNGYSGAYVLKFRIGKNPILGLLWR